MPRVCLLVLMFAASATAAPVPKPDPERERITKQYGTIHEPEGCKLSMDAKNMLTVKMEKVRPAKPVKPGAPQGGLGMGTPEPTGVSLARTVKGAFTATVRFQLKTDLTARLDDAGSVSVGLLVEYPSGQSASIDRSIFVGNSPFGMPQRRVIVASTGSHTNDGQANGFRGKSMAGGNLPSGEGPQYVRIRCTGKKLLLEHQPDGKKWTVFDELAIQEAAEGKIKLSVRNYHGAETEVVIEQFEIK